ncbi:MAG: ATP-binding protein [Gemmatimonadaceae bacterium]
MSVRTRSSSFTPTDSTAGTRRPAAWRWSSWSLTRKLPALTAAIVGLVVATTLALTYDALVGARIEGTHDRLSRVARQIALTSEQNMRLRAATYRQVGSDSAVRAALKAAAAEPRSAPNAAIARRTGEALERLRAAPDSSLPIELWTIDGRRVAHVGTDIRGDSLLALRPELRTLTGIPVTEIPTGRTGSDSIQYGAVYASDGHSVFWTVVPILENGDRVGYIAQQRAFGSTPQAQAMIRELLGNDASLHLHNSTDQFWSNFAGQPIAPLAGVDSTVGDFIGHNRDVGDVIASEATVAGTPWIFTLEAPVSSVTSEPRATIRRLALVSILLALAGIVAAWLVAQRLTQPLVTLTSVSDAIARGDYHTRVPRATGEDTRNEIARLGSTFNRMADEIESSHLELEQQVEEALAVSQQLEFTNEELHRTSADAQEARDAAQQANRVKSDFLAVMSHELRTPLNAIGGYADILQLGIYGAVNEKQQEAVARIVRSQQMLLSLINDVLNFAKLDAGQVQYRMESVAVDDVLAGLEALVAPQLEGKRIAYRFEPCGSAMTVRADTEKLTQIVLNLLSNAVKFTPADGSIMLRCERAGDDVHILVRDSGVGIPDERLDAIFDPFVQVDRALNRPHDGVGLGLSISRDLAIGMDGSLTVESEVGVGSVFRLRLRAGD